MSEDFAVANAAVVELEPNNDALRFQRKHS